MGKNPDRTQRLRQIQRLIDSLCGLYSRVATRLGLDRSFVSRVARGLRRSEQVETALLSEFERIEKAHLK